MGTVFHRTPGLHESILAALRDEPINLLIAIGFDQDPSRLGAVRPHIRVEPTLPQAALLPRCALLVTHGGFNSVKEALAAGVPMVICPIAGDQPYRAKRCEAWRGPHHHPKRPAAKSHPRRRTRSPLELQLPRQRRPDPRRDRSPPTGQCRCRDPRAASDNAQIARLHLAGAPTKRLRHGRPGSFATSAKKHSPVTDFSLPTHCDSPPRGRLRATPATASPRRRAPRSTRPRLAKWTRRTSVVVESRRSRFAGASEKLPPGEPPTACWSLRGAAPATTPSMLAFASQAIGRGGPWPASPFHALQHSECEVGRLTTASQARRTRRLLLRAPTASAVSLSAYAVGSDAVAQARVQLASQGHKGGTLAIAPRPRAPRRARDRRSRRSRRGTTAS